MISLSMAEPDNILRPRISVVGVGGAGGNAINNMIRSNLEGCDFIAANTDSQALAMSLASRKLQLGINLSRGLGAGSRPEIGRAAAEEQITDILSMLEGSDMLFVTAGMGGGTGTGAAPVIARAAREAGILTVGVVTKPFQFEGKHRMRQAEMGINELQQYVDTLIVIPNQNLFRVANERTTFAEAFRLADEVLHSGVRGITDLMVMPGFMNLDFADVKTVMAEMGKAMMGTGEASGENRAICAAEAAISNPLLDDISMKGARGVLINITGGLDMTLFEVDQAANRIREEVDPEAQIKVGSTLGEDLDGRIRVSVIATGIDAAMVEQYAAQRGSGTTATAPASVRIVTETPRRAAVAPAIVKAAPPAQPTVAPATMSVTANYFTMPQPVTPSAVPEMEEQQPVEKTAAAFAEPEVADVEEETPVVAPIARATSGYVAPRGSVNSPLRQSSASAAPARTGIHTVPPAASRHESTKAEKDLRVTQLTTATPAQATVHVNPRSQSLFARITGIGMVRPSAREEEDDLDTDDRATAQQRLSIDPSDRPAISGSESDVLEIPTFLRRQSNH